MISQGVLASLSVSPSTVRFYGVEVGSFGRSETVYIRNNSDKDMNVNVSNGCYGDIDVSSSCFYLNRYGTCTVRVSFRPRRAGYQSCSFTIREQGGIESETVSVSGNATERRR
jgi:hypothetical protein